MHGMLYGGRKPDFTLGWLTTTAQMSGDRRAVATRIASAAGIEECFSELTPDDKAAHVKALQREGHIVAMVRPAFPPSPNKDPANTTRSATASTMRSPWERPM